MWIADLVQSVQHSQGAKDQQVVSRSQGASEAMAAMANSFPKITVCTAASCRVGVHSGECIGGIVGTEMQRQLPRDRWTERWVFLDLVSYASFGCLHKGFAFRDPGLALLRYHLFGKLMTEVEARVQFSSDNSLTPSVDIYAMSMSIQCLSINYQNTI